MCEFSNLLTGLGWNNNLETILPPAIHPTVDDCQGSDTSQQPTENSNSGNSELELVHLIAETKEVGDGFQIVARKKGCRGPKFNRV